MKAAMSEWMSQNTFTIPTRRNVTLREVPRGYLPRSKRRAGETLKTLWKIRVEVREVHDAAERHDHDARLERLPALSQLRVDAARVGEGDALGKTLEVKDGVGHQPARRARRGGEARGATRVGMERGFRRRRVGHANTPAQAACDGGRGDEE
jgi:hypothetical protein